MRPGRPRTFDLDTALDAALHLFWRHGYEGTSLAMLTEALGINAPSLYAAFGNKETLFRTVVDRYIAKQASYVGNACRQPTARLVLETLFRTAIDMVMAPEKPNGCLLVHGALASGPLAEPIRRDLAAKRLAGEAAVRRRLERAITDGDLHKSTNAEDLARYIMSVIWGMSVQAAAGATREQLQAVARLAMSTLPS